MSDPDDLDALVTELNAAAPLEPQTVVSMPGTDARSIGTSGGALDAHTARLRWWLEHAVERSASDLLLVAGAPPSLRIDGLVTRLLEAPLGGEEIADAVIPALPPHARKAYHDIGIADAVIPALPPHARKAYHDIGIADASFRTPDLGRFRINLHHERGRTAAAIRRLPSVVPRLATLGLPPGVEALSRLARGLVLVGGPTGSGKTTTLAALVNEINLRDARHIITIEDPMSTSTSTENA